MKNKNHPIINRIGAEFVPLTQASDMPMSRVEMHMCWSRYEWLRNLSVGSDILEVGAGRGLGAPLVASDAGSYVQIDYAFENSRSARHFNRLPTICGSAEELPFADGSFDVIAGLEMLYYLEEPRAFLDECRRVLRQSGTLFLTMPNPDGLGFHRSPFSKRYFGTSEIADLLAQHDFTTTVFPAFQHSRSMGDRAVRYVLSAAEKLRLIPRTLAGRQRIKNLLPGGTSSFPGIFELSALFNHAGDGVGEPGDFDLANWALLYVVAIRKS